MTDPIMLTAVTTLVTWGTTQLAQGSREAVGSLVTFLRERFRREPAARAAIEGAFEVPSPAATRLLAAVLADEASRDPGFAAEFHNLWARVEATLAASADGVVNSVSGDVSGPVVQARDIRGGISFGG
ncbi:hypothetical protein ACQP2H_15970 [Micromonospora sp. CA-248260]|uniref:hypothetical protein n=1 Tax=Micromonospora sp. CA-248260 TaxID=3239962 RepID=UPI003D8D049A